MKYDRVRFLWPPRPATAQGPDLLPVYEKQGWWAQAKLNGLCLELAISPTRDIIPRTRHDDEPTLWQPGANCRALARSLPPNGWYVFIGELNHTRGTGVKDTIYLHDILVDNSDYLVGQTHAYRQERLAAILGVPFIVHDGPTPGQPWSHIELPRLPGFWLVRNHRSRFTELWDAAKPRVLPGATQPLIEGLVLKDPNQPLKLCTKADSNSGGMAKFRYSTEHLSF